MEKQQFLKSDLCVPIYMSCSKLSSFTQRDGREIESQEANCNKITAECLTWNNPNDLNYLYFIVVLLDKAAEREPKSFVRSH